MQPETVERLSKLYSAVLCDALDHAGFRTQALSHEIRPLFADAPTVGPAKTLLSVQNSSFPERPYEKELEALDALALGEVIVIGGKGDMSAGVWGGLLSTAARAKGAMGAVVDGLTRDAAGIRDMRFPVFARGITPYDSHGRSEVIAYDVPVECGGVTIQPGDIIFGDFDGIVVIPPALLQSTLEWAEWKVRGERIVENEFRKGRRVAEVFAEHGIL